MTRSDPTAFVEDLLARMTWNEKFAQLQIVFRPDRDVLAGFVRSGVGAVFWPRSAAATNAMQRIAVEETRLGIPLLVGLDVIHGQRTIAPTPLAMAASSDPDLVERVTRLAAREAASGGVNWTFSPMIDVSRDPRWGRVVEGFGEDPLLNSTFGAAMIRGYQGDDIADTDSIAATAKHFVGYGKPDGGRDYNTADMSEQQLHDVYLAPFRAAVNAGAASVMAAFNTIGGRPMHANRRMLTDVLKDDLGFDGVIVGDADGVGNLIPHGVAETIEEALQQAMRAGLDVEMGGSLTDETGHAVLTEQQVDPARIDDAVRRVLTLKVRLGLFDNPYVNEGAEITEPSADGRTLVRELASRSTVLLKNDGTLPVRPAGKILFTGPYADSTDHLGAWVQSFGAAPTYSIADAFTARHPSADVMTIPGVGFDDDDPDELPAVAAAAAEADLVVVFVGEPSSLSGEASSRSDLRLPGKQEALIHTVADAGTRFVVVLENGRPLVTADWIERAPAVLEAWHLGTEAPDAVVDVLTGVTEPAGRLPMTFPRSVGQVPIFYAHENTGRPATTGGTLRHEDIDIALAGPDNLDGQFTSKYLDLDLGPQFCFGHGGGYATFEHGTPSISAATATIDDITADGSVEVRVDVTNVSDRDGDETVQLYVQDLVAAVAQPVRRLIAFERRHLPAGATATFAFTVHGDDLQYFDPEVPGFVVEQGRFVFHIGGSLDTTQPVEFQLR